MVDVDGVRHGPDGVGGLFVKERVVELGGVVGGGA